MKKTFVSLVGAALIFSSSNLLITAKASASEVPSVSVKLKNYIGSQTQLTVTVKGEYDIPDSNVSLMEGKTYTLKVENSALSLYESGTLLGKFSSLSTVPKTYGTSNYISINNHPYLGSMNFTIENNAYVRPTDTLPMEDYLKGVVPFEMMASWNREALKAQAVAARTYAVRNQSSNMDDTVSYQAYGGYIWDSNSTAAVDETNSQILTYNDKPIDAFYSASNGGITESNANVWGGTPLAFYPVKTDPYDTKVPWGFTIRKTQIDTSTLDLANPQNWWNSVNEADSIMSNVKSWLAQNGYANDEIKIISVPVFSFSNDKTTGSRVKYANISLQFLLKDKNTGQFIMDNGSIKINTLTFMNTSAAKIRAMFGASNMKSYLVSNFSENDTSYTINGLGNGHGVGMSQWGAKAMADQGLGYQDILNFYFPGTTLTNAKTSSLATPVSLSPRGFIDAPANGGTIRGETNVQGWFLDGSGVSKIDVLVDGNYIGTAQYGGARSDVANAFPNYKNANSGYQFPLDTKALKNGSHTLTVRETGNNGTITDLKSQINVQNLPARGYLDSIVDGSFINGTSNISGWFLDGSGVAKIEVLADGKSVGTAQYGNSRTDVQKAFPDYQNANSGYQFALDTTTLSNGQHTLALRETANNGTATDLSGIKVNVSNVLPIGCIDAPANGSTISGNMNVSGWFLDQKGVSKVDVLVDGQNAGTADYGSSRPDVQNVYPQYQNGNSGYKLTLNSKNIADGVHTLAVQETGMDGNTKILDSLKINVKNARTAGYIDSPSIGAAVSGDAKVSGWFLDGQGVSKIEIVVDGNVMGQADYGNSRQDVLKAFPDFQNANSGYQFTLNTRALKNGQHSLAIRETGSTGVVTNLPSQILNVQNLPARGYLDTPTSGATLNGNANISGWFLDGSGVSTIEVLIDGKSMGAAQYGGSRPDVANALKEYKNANSGFQYTLDTTQIGNGQHTLTVKETGQNSSTAALTSQVMINN